MTTTKPVATPAGQLAKAKVELETAKAKVAELEAKLTAARAAGATIEVTRKIRADLVVAQGDVEDLNQTVKIRETEHRAFVRAECERQAKNDIAKAEQHVATAWVAPMCEVYAHLVEASRKLAQADKALREWPTRIPQPDLSTARTVFDRQCRDAFSRPGARLTDLPTIIGRVDEQATAAAATAIALMRVIPIDDETVTHYDIEEHAA